jgi:hypothetical protein
VKRILGTTLGNYLPAAGLLVVTSLYLYLSYGYPAKARAFPAMVAWVMLALLLLDLVSRTETRLGLAVMRALNPAQARGGGQDPSAWRQVSAILWIAGFTTGIVLIGILSAVPLYVLAAIRFRGGRGYLTALAAAAGATLFIYLLFGVVLRLTLYPGILFTSA